MSSTPASTTCMNETCANGTNSSAPLPPELLHGTHTIVALVLFSVIFCVALPGNLVVLVALLRMRHRKSRVNLLFIHLVIADLLITLVLVPIEAGWKITVAWIAGDFACRLLMFAKTFPLYLSSNVLVCISIDRYLAIVHPLKHSSRSRSSVRNKYLFAAYTVAVTCSIPQLFLFHVEHHPDHITFYQCVTFSSFLSKVHEDVYNWFCLSLLYLLPLLIILFCYTKILAAIAKSVSAQRGGGAAGYRPRSGAGGMGEVTEAVSATTSINETRNGGINNMEHTNSLDSDDSVERGDLCPAHILRLVTCVRTNLQVARTVREELRRSDTRSLERAKMKTLRMTILIVITFLLCWTPFSVVSIWYWVHRPSAILLPAPLQEACFLLACANSALNPLVYGSYAIDLGVEARRLLCCCCGRRRQLRSRLAGNNRRGGDGAGGRHDDVGARRPTYPNSLRQPTTGGTSTFSFISSMRSPSPNVLMAAAVRENIRMTAYTGLHQGGGARYSEEVATATSGREISPGLHSENSQLICSQNSPTTPIL